MPLIQVTMLQGRTADQKRKIAQRITDTMVEEAGARREAIVVTFLEVSKESYASGGVLMIVILALLFRWTLKPGMIEEARRQVEHGRRGRMQGHAEMDMSITEGPFLKRLFSGRGLTAISHNFWGDVTSVWTDIGLGLLIAGALAAWVPTSFWQSFFLTSHPVLSQVWGPLIGPVISMLSFVCSVGNVPLANRSLSR